MILEDASYRELLEYRTELIDRIYGYYHSEMSRDNHNTLSDGFKNYLNEYENVISEIERRDDEIGDYIRIGRSDISPYYYYVGKYEEFYDKMIRH